MRRNKVFEDKNPDQDYVPAGVYMAGLCAFALVVMIAGGLFVLIYAIAHMK